MYTKLRTFILVVGLLLTGMVGNIHAGLAPVEIPGLYNTGIDDSGNVLNSGSVEIHYALTQVPENSGYTSPHLITPHPRWVSPPEGSAWIGPSASANQDAEDGYYTYTLKFDLSEFDPNTVLIQGDWASDNTGEIFLNGKYTGLSNSATTYQSLSHFIINSGFKEGENTLEFKVNNESGPSYNPSGLLVANLQATIVPSSVPLPGAIWLLGSAFVGIIGMRRKK